MSSQGQDISVSSSLIVPIKAICKHEHGIIPARFDQHTLPKVHFCNKINLWKCVETLFTKYLLHIYGAFLCSSCVRHMLFSPSKFSNLYNAGFCCLFSIIGTTPYVCVCSYNNHMYILKQCNWFLDCQTSSMIKILIQVVSL